MDNNLSALTYDELATARAAIRVIRYLTVVATSLAVPMALAIVVCGGLALTALLTLTREPHDRTVED